MIDNSTTHSRQRERDDTNCEGISITEENVKAHIKYSRIKRKILRHVWLVRAAIILLIVAVLALAGLGTLKLSENLGIGNVFSLISSFIWAPDTQVAAAEGRTNILVMGKAGGTHEGPDLTDTMIVASISHTKPQITTISIPRDLWIPEIRAKINSAYYWGNQKTPGGGISFAKAIAGEVTGVPIHYGVVIDFSAFKDIVDALGGIQVNVENRFIDKLYPVEGRENDLCNGDQTFACRYETVTFNSGLQTMNGDTALVFVRSRHAQGSEGTDLAREARQQKVIDAIKSKIMNPKIFLSPKIDLTLLNVLKKYVQTDIDGPTAAVLARNVLRDKADIKQYIIPDNLLFNPPVTKTYDNQYVFIPATGNGHWTQINDWVKEILN